MGGFIGVVFYFYGGDFVIILTSMGCTIAVALISMWRGTPKSLMSTSNQNPTKQHSMACLLQKRMSNLVRGPNRSPSSVPHHNQVSDWTSVRLDSAMLCWMLPVLSVTLEKKQKCLCGCQNEGFKPSAKTQNPLQLKACLPIGSTC